MRQWLELQPPDHFLVVEPTEELREILILEMRKALKFPVEGCGLQNVGRPAYWTAQFRWCCPIS